MNENTREALPMIIGFVTVVIMLGGVIITLTYFQLESKRLTDEQNIKLEENKVLWDSLDCIEKKDYLKDKDLTGSRLFFYNQNEQFYREYMMGCT